MDKEAILGNAITKYATCKGMREFSRIPIFSKSGPGFRISTELEVVTVFRRPNCYKITVNNITTVAIRDTFTSKTEKLAQAVGNETSGTVKRFSGWDVLYARRKFKDNSKIIEKVYDNGTDLVHGEILPSITARLLELTPDRVPKSAKTYAKMSALKQLPDEILDYERCHHLVIKVDKIAKECHFWIDAKSHLIKKVYVPIPLDRFEPFAIFASYFRNIAKHISPKWASWSPEMPATTFYFEDVEFNPEIDSSLFFH